MMHTPIGQQRFDRTRDPLFDLSRCERSVKDNVQMKFGSSDEGFRVLRRVLGF